MLFINEAKKYAHEITNLHEIYERIINRDYSKYSNLTHVYHPDCYCQRCMQKYSDRCDLEKIKLVLKETAEEL